MQVTHATKKSRRTKSKTEAKHGFLRSPCAVACTLDLVGDKWSLLVIRDLLGGDVTYGELQNSPEGIPTNILADRLKRLEQAGLIAKTAYHERPVRYVYGLTEKGKELSDVLRAIVRWGQKHIPGSLALERSALQSMRAQKSAGKQGRNS
jgi:DNA-binding HxlR family transcriptional regulator